MIGVFARRMFVLQLNRETETIQPAKQVLGLLDARRTMIATLDNIVIQTVNVNTVRVADTEVVRAIKNVEGGTASPFAIVERNVDETTPATNIGAIKGAGMTVIVPPISSFVIDADAFVTTMIAHQMAAVEGNFVKIGE